MLKPNGWICFVFHLRRANKLCGTASAPWGREVFKKPFRVSCIEETEYPSCSTCITTFRTFFTVKFLIYRHFIFEKFGHIKIQRGQNWLTDYMTCINIVTCPERIIQAEKGIFVNRNTFQKWMSVLPIK